MPGNTPITVAYGDGIGPEIMTACLNIMQSAGARLDIEVIEVGEKVYLAGNPAGISPNAWDSLRRTKVFYKAPITTPQGGGFKSLNVTARKRLGLYANIRPCVSYHPYVDTKHPKMNVVVVRENEEDLYAGMEYELSPGVMQCLKIISRPGSEKIVRFAFEYAKQNGRRKVTCFTKDNIMKMTDGLFHAIFDEIGAEYPDIEQEHWIVDIGAAKLADTPEAFDVIVMPNLYGDILSDVAAQIAGSVGLAGSANIGDRCAMFEAIHGSAPRRAGQNMANPSGLLHGAILMLVHIGQSDVAEHVHNGWLRTMEDGIHTYDIFKEGTSRKKVGTKEFADAMIERLGQKPEHLKAADYDTEAQMNLAIRPAGKPPMKLRAGVDIFIDRRDGDPDQIAGVMQQLSVPGVKLTTISNRGTKVWPNGNPDTYWSDHWSCRFEGDGELFTAAHIVALLTAAERAGFDVIKTEGLYTFNGERGYSLAQGE